MMMFDDIDFGDALDFGDEGGVGWFSLRSLLLFGVGFGATGLIAMRLGSDTVSASLWGVIGGALGYAVGLGVGMLLTNVQSTTVIDNSALLGKEGWVTVSLSSETLGEVQVGNSYRPARLSGNGIAKVGDSIIVRNISGNVLVVTMTKDLAKEL